MKTARHPHSAVNAAALIMLLEKSVYDFDPANEPIARIVSGSIITMRTMNCFGNQVTSEEQLFDDMDLSHTNPAVGPVYVEDAAPGDALRIEILDIQVMDDGVCCTVPGCGPLHDRSETRTRIISCREDYAEFGGIRFSLDPMIGVIGCTPPEKIPTGWVGDHGGNMDCKYIKKGAVLYCPVYLPGGLLLVGDVHAVMGDCELNGTGLEAPAVVTLKVTLLKKLHLALPVLETSEKTYVIGHGKDYPEALTKTSRVMQDLIVSAYGMDRTDAYIYLSMQGDVEICQACWPCDIDMVLRLGVPKIPGRPLVGRG